MSKCPLTEGNCRGVIKGGYSDLRPVKPPPSGKAKRKDLYPLGSNGGEVSKCKFSDIVEAFKLVSESGNSDKYVRTEEKLVDRSYVVEYHGYSAEDVKLLINQEG